MPTQRKIFTVQNLTEKFKQAKGLVLADYSGLDVNQMNKLRAEVKKAGGEFEVVKNSLLTLAAKNAKVNLKKEALKAPSAALWLYDQSFLPLKAFFQFVQSESTPKVKLGFWQGQDLTLARLQELASLPSQPELLTKLSVLLASPLNRLVTLFRANQKQLLFVLQNAAKGGEN